VAVKRQIPSQVWWNIPVIPALGKPRQVNINNELHNEFQAILAYVVRPCLKKKKRAKSPSSLSLYFSGADI
jgi:hypothetical protein